MPDRQRRLSSALRHGMAHHRYGRCFRRRRGRRQVTRIIRTANVMGSRPCVDAACRPPGNVRDHDKELPSWTRGQNGLTAALLASRNFTSSEQSLEAKYGWANVVSTAND